MNTLNTLAAASLITMFSMTVNASDLSGLDYEDYVQSSAWPTDSYSTQTSAPTVADIAQMIETSPTAAGGDIVGFDLMGDDIHSK